MTRRAAFFCLSCLLLCLTLAACSMPLVGATADDAPAAPLSQRFAVGWLAAAGPSVPVYDEELNPAPPAPRGSRVSYSEQIVYPPYFLSTPQYSAPQGYYQLLSEDGGFRLVAVEDVVATLEETVREQQLYVRATVNLCQADGATLLPMLALKGQPLTVSGFDYINADGSVHMYQVQCGDSSGYLRSWYVTDDPIQAAAPYDGDGNYQTHAERVNVYGGGDAAGLEYLPRDKGFPSATQPQTLMPDEVRALYLGCYPSVIANVEAYSQLAAACGVNAFVVDIMDTTAVAYASPVMCQYSPSAYASAYHSFEDYAAAIEILDQAGFYLIGRITAFNDPNLAADHPEAAICQAGSSQALRLAGSHWPSVYSRLVWQYKTDLAVEAVTELGFDEIQFDYVRFPEYSVDEEEEGRGDFRNSFGETRVQAVQRFLMYAADRLHEVGAYVSVDVFGECNQPYVTAYGQYWPALSNVVDAISGMPYPDHYGARAGGYYPWFHPYEMLNNWAREAGRRQAETAVPARDRTWIQAYDSIRRPVAVYNSTMVGQEIAGLREAGFTGGFMTWNSGSNIDRYRELAPVLGPAES